MVRGFKSDQMVNVTVTEHARVHYTSFCSNLIAVGLRWDLESLMIQGRTKTLTSGRLGPNFRRDGPQSPQFKSIPALSQLHCGLCGCGYCVFQ